MSYLPPAQMQELKFKCVVHTMNRTAAFIDGLKTSPTVRAFAGLEPGEEDAVIKIINEVIEVVAGTTEPGFTSNLMQADPDDIRQICAEFRANRRMDPVTKQFCRRLGKSVWKMFAAECEAPSPAAAQPGTPEIA